MPRRKAAVVPNQAMSERSLECDRRAFVAASAAVYGGLAAPAAFAATPATDAMFSQPCVDVDEWRETPVRHRYIHGGFRGTEARFAIRFLPRERYQGRFFQYITPVPVSEEQASSAFGSVDNFIGFCFDSGGCAVASNQGGFNATASPDQAIDPTIAAYRVSAATARFTRELAGQMYGPHRTYGYAFGGSGGAFRTFGCAENTDMWDGVVPYIHGSAGSIPGNYGARLHGLRVLKSKFPQVADALEPGGGDVYAGLNDEERAVLSEITRLGFPIRTWVFHDVMGIGAFAILFNTIQKLDPGYFEEFWRVPGYQGANPPPSLTAARLLHRTAVKKVIMSNEAAAAGVPAPGGPGRRVSAAPETAWQNLESDYGGGPLPVALQLASPPPPRDLTGASLFVESGSGAGGRVDIARVIGDIVALQFGPASGSLRDVTDHVRAGTEVRIDNSNFLAVHTIYRHHVLPPDYYVYDQFRGPDGRPIYPQRPREFAYDFVQNAMGSQQTGRFRCKMIVMQCLLDWDAAPWHADWYRNKVRQNLGARLQEQYRLWYIDHATHGSIPDPTRVISYQGVLQQALRDVSAWAERGVAPPEETNYQVNEGQVVVPATATERRGIQPVVAVQANGGIRADVRAGEPVEFKAVIEVPPNAGSVIAAEWDFEHGDKPFPIVEQVTPAPRVTLARQHIFSRPGTYFPTLRATSQRQGDAKASYARVQNLGRVRVVVK